MPKQIRKTDPRGLAKTVAFSSPAQANHISKVTVTGQEQLRQPAIDWPVTVTSYGNASLVFLTATTDQTGLAQPSFSDKRGQTVYQKIDIALLNKSGQ